MALKTVEQLRSDYPVFTLVNRRNYTIQLDLRDGSSVTFAAKTSARINSSELAGLPAARDFFVSNPSSAVLQDYDVAGDWGATAPVAPSDPALPGAGSGTVVGINDGVVSRGSLWSSFKTASAIGALINNSDDSSVAAWSGAYAAQRVAALISDSVSETTTWSSRQIESAIRAVQPERLLADARITTTTTWSSHQIDAVLAQYDPVLVLADDNIALDSTWSSQAISDSLIQLLLTIPTIDDTSANATTLWSGARINQALQDFPTPRSVLDDGLPQANYAWSSQRVAAEFAKIPALRTLLSDGTLSETTTWSSQRIQRFVETAIATALAAYDPDKVELPPLVDLLIDRATVSENVVAGVVVGTLSGVPANTTVTFTSNAGGRFVLDGLRVVTTGTPIDFEATPTLFVDVEQYRAVNNERHTTRINIAVLDVNEVVPVELQALALSNTAIDERNLVNALLGQVLNKSSRTTVTQVNGMQYVTLTGLNVYAATEFDYETLPVFRFTLRERDNEVPTNFLDTVITVNVGDVYEAPVAQAPATVTLVYPAAPITTTSPAGTEVARISVTQGDVRPASIGPLNFTIPETSPAGTPLATLP